MKKILGLFLAFLVLLFIGVYVFLFTPMGNKIVANIIEDKAKTMGLDLNVSKFELSFSRLDLEARLANMLNAKIEGNLSLFKLGFDLAYILALDRAYLNSLNLSMDRDLSFLGKVAGVASDFKAEGRGVLFGSNINLDAHIVDYSPLNLRLSANGIRLEEVLDLLSSPRYLTGILNANADLKAEDLKPKGKALINLYTSSINYKLLERDFNLSLPQNSELNGQITADIAGDELNINTELKNSYLIFKTQKTQYDLQNGALNTDFSLDLPNLSKLESLLKSKIKGNLNLNGDLSLNGSALNELNAKLLAAGFSIANLPNTRLNLNARARGEGADKINYEALLDSDLLKITDLKGFYVLSSGELSLDSTARVDDLSKFSNLAGAKIQGSANAKMNAHLVGQELKNAKLDANIAGGLISANSDGKGLVLNIKELDLAKLLVLAAQPAYVNGVLNANAKLSNLDFSKLNGDFSATSKGSFNQAVLSSLLDKKFPPNSKYDLNLAGNIKNSLLSFTSSLKSDLANLNELKGSFDLNSAKLNSSFVLDLFDFSKLGFLADRKLSGKAVFNGNLSFDKVLNAKILSENLFEGKLNAELKDKLFEANLNQVDFASLMRGLDLLDYYEARAGVKLNYNLSTSSGNASANLNNGKLKNVGIIKTISTLTKSDLTKDSFSEANLNAKLNKNSTILDLNMKSPRVSIVIDKGVVSQNKSLNLPINIGIDKANFKGTVTGTTDNPKVSLDLGSLIKTGVDKILSDDKLKERGVKELNKLFDKLF
ncbi:hypothetical protein [Campylobacter troglodytis]|uniref:hypothetical protein n=1 Tax=Campylobacter troglodytis TaxID=654363 RepID=UPI001157FF43|nr:hypothetical protein [Campylobacter troglodytis]TQR61649.1 hypothetical protein DMC01_00345 [Campylobacter troglodytis]